MCMSLEFIKSILIWAVVIGAVFAIIKLLLPYCLGWLGPAGPILVQIFTIVFYAFIIIIVIVIAFALIGCLLSFAGGGLHLPQMR
jgi:hypothetical protein